MLNHSIVQGRLVADPELRKTKSDIAVCAFRVAWSEKYKDTEHKLFLDCTAWRSTGELIAKHFYKGKEIIIEGALHTNTWETDDGQKRSKIEMVVDRVHFCGKKDDSPTVNPPSEFTELDIDDGELPF